MVTLRAEMASLRTVASLSLWYGTWIWAHLWLRVLPEASLSAIGLVSPESFSPGVAGTWGCSEIRWRGVGGICIHVSRHGQLCRGSSATARTWGLRIKDGAGFIHSPSHPCKCAFVKWREWTVGKQGKQQLFEQACSGNCEAGIALPATQSQDSALFKKRSPEEDCTSLAWLKAMTQVRWHFCASWNTWAFTFFILTFPGQELVFQGLLTISSHSICSALFPRCPLWLPSVPDFFPVNRSLSFSLWSQKCWWSGSAQGGKWGHYLLNEPVLSGRWREEVKLSTWVGAHIWKVMFISTDWGFPVRQNEG